MDKVKNNSRKITYSSKKVTEIPERSFPAKMKHSDILGLLAQTHCQIMTDGSLDNIIERAREDYFQALVLNEHNLDERSFTLLR